MKAISKQINLLKQYGNESYNSGAHIGMIFFVVIILFGIAIFKTM